MEFYYYFMSPPSRAVMLILYALGLNPTMKEIDLLQGEQLTPEYKQINPQHTVPVLVDDGFVLSESRAIMIYLVEKYGNNTLYPDDLKAQAVINQRLYFDIGTLYQRFLDVYMPLLEQKIDKLDEKKKLSIDEALGFLEVFIGDSPWMAGDMITIADYSIATTISCLEACEHDIKHYPKITGWYERVVKEFRNVDEWKKGALKMNEFYKLSSGHA